MITVKITPKFSPEEIRKTTIEKDWFRFQYEAFNLGAVLLRYMQSYINANRKRSGGSGRLAKSINLHKQTGAGMIAWGIGHIPTLQNKVPYWYVLNYGKMFRGGLFIPGKGKGMMGSFEGNRPDVSMKGKGTQRWINDGQYYMKPKTPIRPINYIESTLHRLYTGLNKIFRKIKS